MNIIDRAKAPTPKFFKVLRRVGLCIASVGGLFLTAPIALPTIVITVAGYITLTGGIIAAVSQTAIENE